MGLADYSKIRKFTSSMIIPKLQDDLAINTTKSFRNFVKELQKKKYVDLLDFRRFCNVAFIYKDIAYVSDHMSIPENLIESYVFKIMFLKRMNYTDLIKFLKSGLVIFDFNSKENLEYLFNSSYNVLLFFNEKNVVPVKEIHILEDSDDIPEELKIFVSKDKKKKETLPVIEKTKQETLPQEEYLLEEETFDGDLEEDLDDETTKYDEHYFELLEEFGDDYY